MDTGTWKVKTGLAQMLKGGVIMDVVTPDQAKIAENIAKTEIVADLGGARQGKNSWPKIGYNGPMPPKGHGTHHYNFVLYALDQPLDLKAGATKKELLAAMKGHILGEGKLTGIYSR